MTNKQQNEKIKRKKKKQLNVYIKQFRLLFYHRYIIEQKNNRTENCYTTKEFVQKQKTLLSSTITISIFINYNNEKTFM